MILIDQSSAATSEVECYSDNEATQEAVEVILDFVLYTRYTCHDIAFLFLSPSGYLRIKIPQQFLVISACDCCITSECDFRLELMST